jgi:hypothetical protein
MQVTGLEVEVVPDLPLCILSSGSACSNVIDRPATTPDVWSVAQPAPPAAEPAPTTASTSAVPAHAHAPHVAPYSYVSFEDDSSTLRAGKRAGMRTPPPQLQPPHGAERPRSPDGAQGPRVPLSTPPEPPLPPLLAGLPPSLAAAATAIVMGLGLSPAPAVETERGAPAAKATMAASKTELAADEEAGGAERLGDVFSGSRERHGGVPPLPEPGPAAETAISADNVVLFLAV